MLLGDGGGESASCSAVVVLMACGYGVVMSRLDFALRVGVVVAWEKNDSSIEVQGAVVVVIRIVVWAPLWSVRRAAPLWEEGGSLRSEGSESNGAGGERSAVHPRDTSHPRKWNFLQKSWKSDTLGASVTQTKYFEPTIKKGVSSKKLNSKLQT